MSDKDQTVVIAHAGQLLEANTRRQFLKAMSVGGSAVFLSGVLASCSDDDDPTPPPGGTVTLNLGNDVGILNYAYALEQLEAAFYLRVQSGFSTSGLSTAEQTIFTDIRNHEVIHRDAFAALLGTSKIGNLTPDFSAVNFSNRTSILTSAKTFEDLGVSAYNGAGKYLTDVQNLLVAGKIVSVEARHAAVIRDMLAPGTNSFAGDDVVTAVDGLDRVNEPSAVLTAADPFITTTIRIGTQPVA